jgi:transposase-like protein
MKKRATRNHYTAEQKSQVVLEMLREEQTVAQISAKRGVHVTMLHKWKAQALEHLPRVFDSENQAVRNLEAEHDRERQELYAEIGRLTTQLAWLKKKSGLNPETK